MVGSRFGVTVRRHGGVTLRMCLAKSPDLKPTSAVGSGSLKDPAHLFNFLT